MKEKHKKVFVIIFCIVFVIMSIWTSVIAMDIIHTKHCYVVNCFVCNIIHLSANFLRNIDLVYFCIAILVLLSNFRKTISNYTQKIKKKTLVELKIVQIK